MCDEVSATGQRPISAGPLVRSAAAAGGGVSGVGGGRGGSPPKKRRIPPAPPRGRGMDLSAAIAAPPAELAVPSAGGIEPASELVEPSAMAVGPQSARPVEKTKRHSKSRKRPTYIYGNYHRYYGYRMSDAMSEDPRMLVMKKEWFMGKDCLDVGCNEGFVTMGVAATYRTATMLGVDIDDHLIHKARSAHSGMKERYAALAAEQAGQAGVGVAPAALPSDALLVGGGGGGRGSGVAAGADAPAEAEAAGGGGGTEVIGQAGAGRRGESRLMEEDDPSAALASLQGVQFRCENYVETQGKNCSVDVVMCLSVTKWVHLHHGDEGMRALFAKFYRQLTPGGRLILEPQPWKSYRSAIRKQDMSAAANADLNKINFPPSHFVSYLQSQHGFTMEAKLQVKSSAQGFDRPIYVLRKTR